MARAKTKGATEPTVKAPETTPRTAIKVLKGGARQAPEVTP